MSLSLIGLSKEDYEINENNETNEMNKYFR